MHLWINGGPWRLLPLRIQTAIRYLLGSHRHPLSANFLGSLLEACRVGVFHGAPLSSAVLHPNRKARRRHSVHGYVPPVDRGGKPTRTRGTWTDLPLDISKRDDNLWERMRDKIR